MFCQVCGDKMLASHKSSLHTSLLGRGQLAAGCYLRVAMAGGTSVHPSICMSPERGPAGRLCKAAPALTGSHFINSLSSSCSFKCGIITNKAVTLCLRLYNLAKCRYDLGFEEEKEVTSRGAAGRREEPGKFEAVFDAALPAGTGLDGKPKGESAITPPAPAHRPQGASLLPVPLERERRTGRAPRRDLPRVGRAAAAQRARGLVRLQLEKRWPAPCSAQMGKSFGLSPRSVSRPCAGGEGLARGAGWRAPTSASSQNTEQGWKHHW